MSIFHPTNIDELIENAKLELGHPVINIDIADVQGTKAAMKAIDMYVNYHYDATEHVYIAQELTATDIANNYIKTPKNVVNVIRVLGVNQFPQGRSYSCWSSQGGMFGSSIPVSGGMAGAAAQFQGDLVSMYLADANRSYFKSILFPNIPMEWNKGSKRIRFLGDIRQSARGCNKFVVYEARVVNENLCFDCENPEGEGSCFYDNEWLKAYTAAQIKLIWGNNMSKFTSISLTNGFEFNGDRILDSARQDIDRLELELFDRYTIPATMLIG